MNTIWLSLFTILGVPEEPYCQPPVALLEQIKAIHRQGSGDDLALGLWKRSQALSELQKLRRERQVTSSEPSPEEIQKAGELANLKTKILDQISEDFAQKLDAMGSDASSGVLDDLSVLFFHFEDWDSAKSEDDIQARIQTHGTVDPRLRSALSIPESVSLRAGLLKVLHDADKKAIDKISKAAAVIEDFPHKILRLVGGDQKLTQEQEEALVATFAKPAPTYEQMETLVGLASFAEKAIGAPIQSFLPAMQAQLQGRELSKATLSELISALEKSIFPWNCAQEKELCEALGGSTAHEILRSWIQSSDSKSPEENTKVSQSLWKILRVVGALNIGSSWLLKDASQLSKFFEDLYSDPHFSLSSTKEVAELVEALRLTAEWNWTPRPLAEVGDLKSLKDLMAGLGALGNYVLPSLLNDDASVMPTSAKSQFLASALIVTQEVEASQFNALAYVSQKVSSEDIQRSGLNAKAAEDRRKEILLLRLFNQTGTIIAFSDFNRRPSNFDNLMQLETSDLALMNFLREFIPTLPLPESQEAYQPVKADWFMLANELQSFQDALQGRMEQPPKVFFKSIEEFRKESLNILARIRAFQRDLPLGSLEDMGWPKSPRILRFKSGDDDSLRALLGSSQDRLPAQQKIYLSTGKFLSDLSKFDEAIQEKKKRIAEKFQIPAATLSLLELESLEEVSHIDATTANSLLPSLRLGATGARLDLLEFTESKLGDGRLIRAIYQKKIPEEATAMMAQKAILLLLGIENFKRNFGAMSMRGQGNLPKVQWAQDYIETRIKELIDLKVIQSSEDPRLDDLLQQVIPQILDQVDRESGKNTSRSREAQLRLLQQQLEFLEPAIFSGSNVVPTAKNYSKRLMAEYLVTLSEQRKIQLDQVLRILVEAIATHETAKIGSVSISVSAQRSVRDEEAENKLIRLKGEWDLELLKIGGLTDLSFINYLQDLTFRVFPSKLESNTRLNFTGAKQIQRERQGGAAWTTAPLGGLDTPRDVKGFADYLMSELQSIKAQSEPEVQRIRRVSKGIQSQSAQFLKDWKFMELPESPDRSRSKEATALAPNYQNKWDSREQVHLVKLFRHMAFQAMQPFEEQRLKRDQVLLSFFSPDLSKEARSEMQKWFLDARHGIEGSTKLSRPVRRIFNFAGLPVTEGLATRLSSSESSAPYEILENLSDSFFEAGKTLAQTTDEKGALSSAELNLFVMRLISEPHLKNSFLTWGDGMHHDNPLNYIREFTAETLNGFLAHSRLGENRVQLDLKKVKKQISALRILIQTSDLLFGADQSQGALVVGAQALGLELLDRLPKESDLSKLGEKDAFARNISGLKRTMGFLKLPQADEFLSLLQREYSENRLKNWPKVAEALSALISLQMQYAQKEPKELDELLFAGKTQSGEDKIMSSAEIFKETFKALMSFFPEIQNPLDLKVLESVFTSLVDSKIYRAVEIKSFDSNHLRNLLATSKNLTAYTLDESLDAALKERPKPWYSRHFEITQPYNFIRSTGNPAEHYFAASTRLVETFKRKETKSSLLLAEDQLLYEVYGPGFKELLGASLVSERSRALQVMESLNNLRGLAQPLVASKIQDLLNTHFSALKHNMDMKQAKKPPEEWRPTPLLRLKNSEDKETLKEILESVGLEDPAQADDPKVQAQVLALHQYVLALDEFVSGFVSRQQQMSQALMGGPQGVKTVEILDALNESYDSAKRYGIKPEEVIAGLNKLVAHESKDSAKFYQQEIEAAEMRSANPLAMIKVGAGSAGHFVYGIAGSYLGLVFTGGESLGIATGLLGEGYFNLIANMDEDGNFNEMGAWDLRQFMLGRTLMESAAYGNDSKLYQRVAGDAILAIPIAGLAGKTGLKALARAPIALAREALTSARLKTAIGEGVVVEATASRLLSGASKATGFARFWESGLGNKFVKEMAKTEARNFDNTLAKVVSDGVRGAEKNGVSLAAQSMGGKLGVNAFWAARRQSIARSTTRLVAESAVFTGVMYLIDSSLNPSALGPEGISTGERAQAIAGSFGQNLTFFALLGLKNIALSRAAIRYPVAGKFAHAFGSGVTYYIYSHAGKAAVKGVDLLAYKAASDWGMDWLAPYVRDRTYDKLPRDQTGIPIFQTSDQSREYHEDIGTPAEVMHNVFLIGFIRFHQVGAEGVPILGRFAKRSPFWTEMYPSRASREQRSHLDMNTTYRMMREFVVRAKDPRDAFQLKSKILEPIKDDPSGRSPLVRDYESLLRRRTSKEEREEITRTFEKVFEKARKDGESYRIQLARLKDQEGQPSVSPEESKTAAFKKFMDSLEDEVGGGRPGLIKYENRQERLEAQGLGSFLHMTFEGRELRTQVTQNLRERQGGASREVQGMNPGAKFRSPESFTGFLTQVEKRTLAEIEIQPQAGAEGKRISHIRGPEGLRFTEEAFMDGRIHLYQHSNSSPWTLKMTAGKTQWTGMKDGSIEIQNTSGHRIRISSKGEVEVTNPQKRVETYESVSQASGALREFGIVSEVGAATPTRVSATALVTERRLPLSSEAGPGWPRKAWRRIMERQNTAQYTERQWAERITESVYPDGSVKLTFRQEDGKVYSIPISHFVGNQRYSIDPVAQKVSLLDDLGVTTTIDARTGAVTRGIGSLRFEAFHTQPMTLEHIYWEVLSTYKGSQRPSESYAARMQDVVYNFLRRGGVTTGPKSLSELMTKHQTGLDLMEIDLNKTPLDQLTSAYLQGLFRRAALKFHPDVYKGTDARDKMSAVIEANDVLKQIIRLRDLGIAPEL